MTCLPELTVGPATREGHVTVLPIYPACAPAPVDYRLGHAALAEGALEIRELAGAARVDALAAWNRGHRRVLIVEGDHLTGVKQNRVVTSSAMIGGKAVLELPVSCVERGRWADRSRAAAAAVTTASANVRRAVKVTVTRSLIAGRGRRADQGQIWSEIADQHRRFGVTSATCAMSDTYAARGSDLARASARLPYPGRATGLAIAVGGELVSIDVFDQPATCAHYWRRLIEGVLVEGQRSPAGIVGPAVVDAVIAQLRAAAWVDVPPIGDGVELRAATPDAAASMLVVDGRVVHFGAAAVRAVSSPRYAVRIDLPSPLEGRYRIVERIGVGSHKEVYRATELPEGGDVAIARVPFVEPTQFKSEIALLRRIDSPHVARVHHAFVDDGAGYIVMEYCNGPTLGAIVRRRPLAVGDAGPVMVAFARGVRSIHAAHVLHRDLKLDNVVLCAGGGGGGGGAVLKVLDFGLSARARSESTAVGVVRDAAGTLPYMARENLRGAALDARTDVYAFGVCCFAMLTGRLPAPPRDDENELGYMQRLASIERHDLGALPALPDGVRALMARMLDSARDHRPFMPEVVEVLERAFGDRPIPAALATDPSAAGAGAVAATGAVAGAVAGAGAVAVADAGAGAVAGAGAGAVAGAGAGAGAGAVAGAGAGAGAGAVAVGVVNATRVGPAMGAGSGSRRLALDRVAAIAVPVAAPEHVLVAPCPRVPIIALEPGAATRIHAHAPDGGIAWRREVDGAVCAGVRADLDGDGVRELYLAGPDRVIALDVDGRVRYTRPRAGSAAVPSLLAIPDPAAPRLAVDGRLLDPRTGEDTGPLPFACEGGGERLVEAADARGAAYNGFALQAFRGTHATPAAIVHHPGRNEFVVAQLEQSRHGRRVQLAVYGPGGHRLHHRLVADCDIGTGDALEISRLHRDLPLFGPEHAPLALLGAGDTAVLITPLLGADRSLPPSLAAFSLPDGRELWRRRLDVATTARALFADLAGTGRPALVVGTGRCLIAYDPWTGEPSDPLITPGIPIAFGDPCGTGFAHLITAHASGLDFWRARPCSPGTLAWSGPRADLWRTGTLRADGLPLGPL